MLEFIEWSMTLSKAPPEKISDSLEKARAQNYKASLKSDVMAYCFFLIIGFFYALIIAAVYHLISKGYANHHVSVSQSQSKK
jgi:hypothetical protein